MKWTLVAYDVPDDKRRDRVSRALEKLGYRVQLSVFLIPDADPEHLRQLLQPLLELRRDNLRIHPLCRACFDKAHLLGTAAQPDRDKPFHIY